jgi:hypothetical protein
MLSSKVEVRSLQFCDPLLYMNSILIQFPIAFNLSDMTSKLRINSTFVIVNAQKKYISFVDRFMMQLHKNNYFTFPAAVAHQMPS